SAEAGASLAGEYGQVSPGYRLSLSLNLAELFRDRGPALRALEAQAEAARREARARAAEAFFRWLAAREAARAAADGVEAREAELRALQARARVGAAAPHEVLAAAERLSQARLALYRANLDLALALENLARVVGLPLEALRALLRPLEGGGGTSPTPQAPKGP
ncbi:TolC family protein, partial [Thermus sp.]|uniref:TolC family protein n=1 Tax=Thermus sp. TaxID=275 RepID=UPI003D0C870C